jgi:uncharacterized protein with HEPN domain
VDRWLSDGATTTFRYDIHRQTKLMAGMRDRIIRGYDTLDLHIL